MSSTRASVTFKNCIDWRLTPTINPVTKRRIKADGDVANQLRRDCEQLMTLHHHTFRPDMTPEAFGEMYKAIHSELDKEGVRLITTGQIQREHVIHVRELVRAIEGHLPVAEWLEPYTRGGERSKFFLLRKKANQLLHIKDTLQDMQPVEDNKSYESTKSVSSSKKSLSSPIAEELSPLPKKTRQALLNDLEQVCSEMLDAITYEEFNTFRKKKLHLIVAIGPETSKKHCYYVKSLHGLWRDSVQNNKPFKDPLDPSHRVSAKEQDEIYKKMRYIDPSYKRPERQQAIDPRLNMKIEEEPSHPGLFHITVTFRLGQVAVFWDLGFIPADLDQDQTGSLDMTSTAMAGKIYQLFAKGRIFKSNFIPIDGSCCRIHLWKKPEFWGEGEERLRKFRELMQEIDRAM